MRARPSARDSRRLRLTLAVLSALLVAGSCALILLERGPHARPRVTAGAEAQARVAPRAAASLGEIATQVQDSVAAQSQQEAIRSWESEHHELPDAQLTPSTGTRAAIDQVDRAASLWLRGYLPYEVDRLTAVAKRDLLAGSTPTLAGRLLADPPLIPPAGSPPVQGRLVTLSSTLASGARRARMYVEIGYGPERYGLRLTLTRDGTEGWLVAVVQG